MELADQAAEPAEVLFFSECFSLFRNVAAVIGAVWLLNVVQGRVLVKLLALKTLLNTLLAYFLAPWYISRMNLKKYSNWAGELCWWHPASWHMLTSCDLYVIIYYGAAVVTGASKGIGRRYAIEVSKWLKVWCSEMTE